MIPAPESIPLPLPQVPQNWTEYCDRVFARRPHSEDDIRELVHCGHELLLLLAGLDRDIASRGHEIFTSDEESDSFLHSVAGIFAAATAFQDALGTNMLRAMAPVPKSGLRPLNQAEVLTQHSRFHLLCHRNLAPGKIAPEATNEKIQAYDTHRELYEQQMSLLAHEAMAAAVEAGAGMCQALLEGTGQTRTAVAAHNVMAVLERMLVINGFTAVDAAMRWLVENKSHVRPQTDPGRGDPAGSG